MAYYSVSTPVNVGHSKALANSSASIVAQPKPTKGQLWPRPTK